MNTAMIAAAMIIVETQWVAAPAEPKFARDRIKTPSGDIEITFIGHGTLMLEFGGKTIHIDPWTHQADYTKLPKADVILVTHDHRDHLDTQAIEAVRTEHTELVLAQTCTKNVTGGLVMKNGDVKRVAGIKIEAVPAYNLVNKRENGQPFHPKGSGNGYVLTLGGKRVYVAGDTENTPEMKSLKDIAAAFLPMNLPYTMTPEMVADAAKAFRPQVLYPYHMGDTDPSRLVELMKDEEDVAIRIRKTE